jgi:hypothetical protein
MGMIIDPHEVYFGTFFERFNMRFGPAQAGGGSLWQAGGIMEVAALQKEFEIFKRGRPFIESAALLGLGGLVSSPAKDRWLEYLGRLPKMKSDDPELNGDERVVSALIENLAKTRPMPCHIRAYDGRLREPGLVLVNDEAPIFYLESVKFLTISLPMRPSATKARTPSPRARTAKRATRK